MSATQGLADVKGMHASHTADTTPAKKISPELTLTPFELLQSKTQFVIQEPDEKTAFNILASGSQPARITIPPGVYNFAQSKITYDCTIADQGAGNFVWSSAKTLGEINALKLASQSGALLIDTEDWYRVQYMLAQKEMKMATFLTGDDRDALFPSRISAATNYIDTPALGSNSGFVDQTEPRHNRVSAVGVGAAGTGELVKRVVIKGEHMFDSFMAVDKLLPVGEPLVLTIKFSADGAGHLGTSAVNPATGASQLVAGRAASVNSAGTQTCVYISNLKIHLASETRQGIIEDVMKQFDSAKGLAVYFPWVRIERKARNGNSVTHTASLSSSDGIRVRKAITSVFDNSQATNKIFDRSNLYTTNNAGDDAKALRVVEYVTRVDGKVQQQDKVTANYAYGSDWLVAKEVLKGGVIQGRKAHYYDWAIYEQWMAESPENGLLPPEALGGLALDDPRYRFRTYDIVAKMAPSDGAYAGAYADQYWFTVFVTTRKATFWPSKIMLE